MHSNWARRGIGQRIIEAYETAAHGAGFRSMELGATLPGEPFYVAMGYKVTTRFDIGTIDGDT